MSQQTDAAQWFKSPAPNSRSRVRLFCFPYAGGSAAIFHHWSRSLPHDIEVCPVMLPGRGSRMREPPLTRLSTLVEQLARAIEPYLDKPFAFFGHSMGAFIGFELARSLRRQAGVEPAHLFVSGCRAPQLPDSQPLAYDLPDHEFIEYLRELNGTPEEMLGHPELMALMMPLLRADFEAVSTYVYADDAALSCPISAYGGLRDATTTREDLAPWSELTTGRFVLRMFDGDHFFIQHAAPLLLATLSRELAQLVAEVN
ncbi:MAG: thioesterase II family protein [Pyrinomonadaceae bacterium]